MREVLVEAARTQLAAVTAATRFWAGWAEVADKYAQTITDELARIEAEGDASDTIGRLSDLTREYIRDVGELPSDSVKRFNGELEKIRAPKPRKRTRAARAKD